jgi:hypothetical protein
MSQNDIILIVGGVIATILGGIDLSQSNLRSLTAWGVVVLGVTLVLLALA